MPGFIDFKQLAEEIDIEAVAALLNLALRGSAKELRGKCPACDSDNERALQVIPQTNSFRCYAAEKSGDCISLYAHIQGVGMYAAAKRLQEHFAPANAGRTAPVTSPQKPEGGRQPAPTSSPKSEHAFEPAKFAEKLKYTEEVKALGITEEDAKRFSIGFLRGRVYFPVRYPSGEIAGFIGHGTDGFKVPSQWVDSKVVPFARRA